MPMTKSQALLTILQAQSLYAMVMGMLGAHHSHLPSISPINLILQELKANDLY